MDEKHWYLIIGIVIGWITKFPLLLKWYRELKRTKEYKRMKMIFTLKKLKNVGNNFILKKLNKTKTNDNI